MKISIFRWKKFLTSSVETITSILNNRIFSNRESFSLKVREPLRIQLFNLIIQLSETSSTSQVVEAFSITREFKRNFQKLIAGKIPQAFSPPSLKHSDTHAY